MSATTPDNPFDEQALRRYSRLVSSVRELQTRARRTDGARLLLILGGVLLPLGIVLILLGWSGVSHTTDTFEQTPYVVSGGLLGLGLVVAGGFCHFGYWQTLTVRAMRRDAEDLRAIRDSLRHIEALLAANPSAAVPEAPRAARARRPRRG